MLVLLIQDIGFSIRQTSGSNPMASTIMHFFHCKMHAQSNVQLTIPWTAHTKEHAHGAYLWMTNSLVFNLNGADPFAPRLDDVLSSVRDLHQAIGMQGAHISCIKVTVLNMHQVPGMSMRAERSYPQTSIVSWESERQGGTSVLRSTTRKVDDSTGRLNHDDESWQHQIERWTIPSSNHVFVISQIVNRNAHRIYDWLLLAHFRPVRHFGGWRLLCTITIAAAVCVVKRHGGKYTQCAETLFQMLKHSSMHEMTEVDIQSESASLRFVRPYIIIMTCVQLHHHFFDITSTRHQNQSERPSHYPWTWCPHGNTT